MIKQNYTYPVQPEADSGTNAQIVELTLALAEADRELARANQEMARLRLELAQTQEQLTREIVERTRAEEGFARAISGARCLYWLATVTAEEISADEARVHWDTAFLNEEVIKAWLPLEIPPGDNLIEAWYNAVDPSDNLVMEPRSRDAILSGQAGYEQEFRLILAPGDIMWFHEEVTIKAEGPSRWSLTGRITDITWRKRREDQVRIMESHSRLEALAFHDDLTGLHNRRAFHDRFNLEFERAKQYHTPLSLIMLDVDRFKDYNDAYGHPAGDIVLKSVALLLLQNARDIDFVARYGGEEIAVILPGDRAKSLMMAERLREALEQAAWAHRPITASFGVTTFESAMTHSTPGLLIGEADEALYLSKTSGRNRVTHAHPASTHVVETGTSHAINVGGAAIEGSNFVSDTYHGGGSVRAAGRPVDISRLAAGTPFTLFETERLGKFSYNIPNIKIGGMYLVRLYFAETQWSRIGERIFDIAINGGIEAKDFDIIAEAGAPNVAVVKDFPVAVTAGGDVKVALKGKTDGALLHGLEIIPLTYSDNISINCGDIDAWPFLSDRYYAGGNSMRNVVVNDESLDQYEVDLTFPKSIYRTQRHGTFTYTIPRLPIGARCLVALHFREIYQTSTGKRIFHVHINGTAALSEFDILAASLVPYKPVIKRCFATANGDGEIVIDFIPLIDFPQVVAIEVHW